MLDSGLAVTCKHRPPNSHWAHDYWDINGFSTFDPGFVVKGAAYSGPVNQWLLT